MQYTYICICRHAHTIPVEISHALYTFGHDPKAIYTVPGRANDFVTVLAGYAKIVTVQSAECVCKVTANLPPTGMRG